MFCKMSQPRLRGKPCQSCQDWRGMWPYDNDDDLTVFLVHWGQLEAEWDLRLLARLRMGKITTTFDICE